MAKRVVKRDAYKSSLTASEIISIIKECAKAKVSEINFGDLRLNFSDPLKATGERLDFRAFEPNTVSEPVQSEKHDSMNKEALETEELRLKESRLDLMFIENPYEAEKLIASGELNEDYGDDNSEE